MRNAIIGAVIGMVVGTLFGASVVAPRLAPDRADTPPVENEALPLPAPDSGTPPATEQPVPSTLPGALRWQMAAAYPSSLPVLGSLAKDLEATIRRVSGGTIAVIHHEPGALVPPGELLEAVRSGAADAAFAPVGFWQDTIPALGLFGSAPFGPPPRELLAWLHAGGGLQLLREIHEERGLHAEPCGIAAPAGGGWFNREIHTIDDLKGLRMRIGGLAARVLQRLGVEPVALPPDAIDAAFDDGRIDAAEFSMPSVDHALDLHSKAREYYFPGWHKPSSLLALVVPAEAWQSLAPVQRSRITTVCGDLLHRSFAEGEGLQFDALIALGAEGARVHRWPEPVIARLKTAWKEITNEETAADPEFARVWQSLSAFREDFDIWRDLSRF